MSNLQQHIELDPLGRRIPPKAEKNKPDVTIIAWYYNRLQEATDPAQMLKDLHLVHPDANIQVSYKVNDNLAALFKDTNQFRQNIPPCQCGLPGGQHLCTTSTDWIPEQYQEVKHALASGLNHIPLAPLDINPVLEQNETIAKHFGGPAAVTSAREWTLSKLASCRIAKVDTPSSHVLHKDHPGVMFVKNICFVTCVDKASNQPLFICKHHAVTMALDHCCQNPSFSALPAAPPVSDALAAIIAEAP